MSVFVLAFPTRTRAATNVSIGCCRVLIPRSVNCIPVVGSERQTQQAPCGHALAEKSGINPMEELTSGQARSRLRLSARDRTVGDVLPGCFDLSFDLELTLKGKARRQATRGSASCRSFKRFIREPAGISCAAG